MSFLSDASLVMIPSGYKDGKLYSAKPTNGDGDFTFSRGSNLAATRVNSEGLIEKGRENLLLHSQDFSNANWQTNASATISHGITDPNGGSTASRLTFAASVNSGIYQQNLTLFASGNVRTASLYMKGAVGGENVMIGDANNRTRVTLTTDWVRYEGFATDSSTFFIIYTDHISGASADTIDIAFVQYENGLVATDYIETTTTTAQAGILEDMPRLDYSGGASCPSLLLEPQRSNILPQSEYFGAWTFYRASITNNTIDSPEGVQNGTTLIEDSTNNTHLSRFITSSLSGNHTISVFIKDKGDDRNFALNTSDNTNQYIIVNPANGTIEVSIGEVDADIEDYGNGWYRVYAAFNLSSSTFVDLRILQKGYDGIPSSNLYLGDGTSGFYIYGAQLEAGSYPTSYIPTYGASVTRGADSCSKTGISELIGQTEGTLFFEGTIEGINPTTARRVVSLSDGTNSNLFQVINLDNSLDLRYELRSANSSVFTINDSNAFSLGQKFKFAFAYANNNFAFYVNGNQVGTSTSGSVIATSVLRFARGDGANPFEGANSQLLLFKTRLSNTELAQLTTL